MDTVTTAPVANIAEPTIEEIAAAMAPAETVMPVIEETAPVEEVSAEVEAASAEEAAVTEVAPEAPTEVDAALERAQKAAQKAREGSRRYQETQAQLREQSARVQRAAQEAEALRRDVQAARAREEALLKDPYKALKDRGMTDRDLAERAMRENAPEAVTLRLADELKVEREARVALERRIQQQAEEAQMAAARAKAHTDLVQATEDETACPELSQLTPDGRLDMVRLALQRIESNGHSTDHLTLAQIVEAGEKYVKLTRKGGKTAPAAAPVARPTVAKTSGKTLTNTQAQTRTVAPASWDTLSEEQQLAHIAASLPEPM